MISINLKVSTRRCPFKLPKV